MTEAKTYTLTVPGAELTYDVREGDAGAPTLLVIGSPMGASGFGTLAGHFTDRTVVTYDPRGVERSRRTDGAAESTPDEHANDLHRLISTLGTGPVDIFATSGGAVNALALVARHAGQVGTLVAHEPPAVQVLPDRAPALAACLDIKQTYERAGFGPAMAKFIALVSVTGPIPEDYLDRPAPEPAMFGLPTSDDGSRGDALVGQNIVSCTHYEHDFSALRNASSRIVLATGANSVGQLAYRATLAIAQRLGADATIFPGDHGGFLGGEYGQTGEPDAFAAKLRQALAGDSSTDADGIGR